MPESYAYHVGDLVHAGSVGGPRPAIINSIQGKDVIIRYIAKSRGLALLKQAELTPNKDFDWCGGIALDSLQEGSAVEGRYLHGEGSKKWFRGKIAAINSNGTFAISYNDGDYEASVLRENIRTEADRDRPNPQLAQLKGKSMNQSFASSLSPAHRDSESPKQTTKPAQAEPAEATSVGTTSKSLSGLFTSFVDAMAQERRSAAACVHARRARSRAWTTASPSTRAARCARGASGSPPCGTARE